MLGYDMNIVERGIRGLFAREFITRQRKVKYPLFSTIIDSDKKEEKFNAISTLPQLQEMTDERVLAGFSEYSYTLANKVYTTGIKVPRTLFEFDQTGQLRTLIQSMSARIANFPDKLVCQVLGLATDTTKGVCYDKKPFIAATHDLGNGTSQDNTLTGGLTDTLIAGKTKANRDDAIAAIQADMRLAKAKLLGFTDDRGEPWHDDAEPESLVVICTPDAEWYIRTALEATLISDTINVSVKSVGKVITYQYLDPFKVSGTYRKGTWYLCKVDTPIQGLIFQRFGPKANFPDSIPEADQTLLQALNTVELQSIMRVGKDIDSQTFFNDEFLFGARCIYSAGYGMWQNVIKVNGGN